MEKEKIRKLKREYKELTNRITKLSAFMNTDVYVNLPKCEKGMLSAQFHAMNVYCLVLGNRISFYKGEPIIFEWRCNE